jgi:hypothetical protein
MSLAVKVDASNLGGGKLFGIFISNSWTKDHLGLVPLQWHFSGVSFHQQHVTSGSKKPTVECKTILQLNIGTASLYYTGFLN